MDYIAIAGALGLGGVLVKAVEVVYARTARREDAHNAAAAADISTERELVKTLATVGLEDRNRLWERVGALDTRLTAAVEVASKAQAALADMQRQLDEAHMRIETLQAENEAMHEEREALRSEVALLRGELAKVKAVTATMPAPA